MLEMMAMLLPAGQGCHGVPDLQWVCFQAEQVGAVASPEDWEKVWDNWRPLTMAGIFDCWEPPEGGSCLYSYSIITVDSCRVMTDIHNRQVAPPPEFRGAQCRLCRLWVQTSSFRNSGFLCAQIERVGD